MNGQRDKLLIVDDDRLIADTTALIFTHAGYDVEAVYSAEQALELIQKWPPSAAILDVLLPQMGGITLAELMRTTLPDCRIVLFSSQAVFDDRIAAAHNDFFVLAKPVHPSELLDSIGKLLKIP